MSSKKITTPVDKVYYIYEIVNLINGKTYVGKHITTRFPDNYMGSGIALKKAIEKYGKQNFIKNVLEFASNKEELSKLEKLFIKKYKSEGKAEYNLTKGGEGGDTLSLRSETDNLKRCIKLKNYWQDKKNVIQRNQKTYNTWKSKTEAELTQFRKNHSHFLYSPTNNLSEKLVLSECAEKYNVSLQTLYTSACFGGKVVKKLGFGFIRIPI